MATPAHPPVMRAWTHSRAGTPSTVLSLSSSHPVPMLTSPASVLVRISHAALNPGGSIMMQLCPSILRSFPAVPELDFSGTVVAVGGSIPEPLKDELQPGAAVFGSVPVSLHLKAGMGALAEYVVVQSSSVCAKPRDMSFEEAAGLGVAGSTALCLVEAMRLGRGNKVLVNGASGGIGTIVVQLVRKAVGESGMVVGVCSGRNAEMVRGLGADEIVDYTTFTRKAPLHGYLKHHHDQSRFDAVVDCRGVQELYAHCAGYLKDGKPFVTVGPAPEEYTISGMLYTVLLMLRNAVGSALPMWLGGVGRKYLQVNGLVDSESLRKLRGRWKRMG
ncbi:hypothetical protein H2199_004042 [Coniosporium tulheliwenetii]|uniref:Uncharacterized protein n=1 Tax=Coniosporium tulheliwenetii TaxID=3383036 RepID=A0ACC2Z758_9PEZI|nr:hypothetical protein H2199_004042 [Cladosporium sp. JES 115]